MAVSLVQGDTTSGLGLLQEEPRVQPWAEHGPQTADCRIRDLRTIRFDDLMGGWSGREGPSTGLPIFQTHRGRWGALPVASAASGRGRFGNSGDLVGSGNLDVSSGTLRNRGGVLPVTYTFGRGGGGRVVAEATRREQRRRGERSAEASEN